MCVLYDLNLGVGTLVFFGTIPMVFSRYVRNIPMSAVLDRGGLQQRWVAVSFGVFFFCRMLFGFEWFFNKQNEHMIHCFVVFFFFGLCNLYIVCFFLFISDVSVSNCQVYPPGDPLNLHFDPVQLPRDGSPQAGCAGIVWSSRTCL